MLPHRHCQRAHAAPQFAPTSLSGVVLIQPDVRRDARPSPRILAGAEVSCTLGLYPICSGEPEPLKSSTSLRAAQSSVRPLRLQKPILAQETSCTAIISRLWS